MKRIYIICLVLFASLMNGQNAEIEGFVEGVKDSTIVWFNGSVDNNYENYLNNSQSTILKNNAFKKSFNIKGTGFISTSPNLYINSIHLIIEEGNKIKVKLKKDNNEFYIIFEGDNAAGLEELNRSKFFNFKKLSPYVMDIFKNSKSSDEFLNAFADLRLELLKPFDTFLIEKKITNSFFKAMQLNADLTSLFVVNMAAYNLKDNADKKAKIKISEVELNNILIKLDQKYNAFDSKYNNCNGLLRIIGVQRKCQNISNGLLFGIKQDIGIWSKAEESYNYAPLHCQELMMADNIKYSGFKSSGCTYEKFKKEFPKSVYLDNLKQINDISKTESEVKIYSLGTYTNNSKKLEIKSTSYYKDLQELVKDKFKGSFVFVDLWASYCAPCKKEFSYSAEMDIFFTNHNIEMLYVSIDSESQIQKSVEDIYAYNLKGNHYFATDEIQTSLRRLLKEKDNIFIPRYLLFNSKGELVLNNAKRPSEGKALYSQIIQAIK